VVKRSLFLLFLALSLASAAQSRPTGACPFAGFDTSSQRDPKIAEVQSSGRALAWTACDSPKGCFPLRFDPGSPVLIYAVKGAWTCGYSADRHGAGPAWFRSSDLRPVRYTLNPPLAAWSGTWTGGENHVILAPAKSGKALHLKGNATWHGANGNEHFGDAEGDAVPTGNHLHFVEGDSAACVIDLTLLGKFILASDNQGCGGMNARFEGLWKRSTGQESGKTH
jgi:hypothetical protein